MTRPVAYTVGGILGCIVLGLALLLSTWRQDHRGGDAGLEEQVETHWRALPLLPGATCFDVTKPPFNAVPDDANDDTAAIKAAMKAAAEHTKNAKRGKLSLQQMVYLPAGTYLVSDTLECLINHVNPDHAENEIRGVEAYQWIKGDGAGRTVLKLRSASEIGTFGTAESPKPVLQTARYAYDARQNGNAKFQLWVTDLSIVVPEDQPYAVGLSYGVANMGAVRRVGIQAKGRGGYTGLALVQNNNGPGLVEQVRIEGFATGLEVNDLAGKNFHLNEIEIANQHPGGVAMALSDKVISVENLSIEQDQGDVVGIHLRDTRSIKNKWSATGGMAHLTLLNPRFRWNSSGESSVPAIDIERGHLYMRGAEFSGFGAKPIRDHGKLRQGTRDELVLIHGRSKEEESKVVVAMGGAPAESLHLPIEATPEIPMQAWDALTGGDFTTVSGEDLKEEQLAVETSWVIVEASGQGEDTELLQAALDSGARYVGLLNGPAFVTTDTLTVNGPGTPGNVELIHGHMTDLFISGPVVRNPPYDRPNAHVGIRLCAGRHSNLFIKGVRIDAKPANWKLNRTEDFQVFQNDAACTVVFEDVRAKCGPRHYRNGVAAEGQKVFFDNVEFAYSNVLPQECVVIRNQKAWARSFNVERNILDHHHELPDARGRSRTYTAVSTAPHIVNDEGQLFIIGQKVGEHTGPFFRTRKGGRTELLGVFFNQKTSKFQEPTKEAAILIVEGADSACSMVGTERTRNHFYPHGNALARLDMPDGETLVECTSFPTYRRHDGFDPFEDRDEERYQKKRTNRVFGLFRVGRE
jgi:hypothetical protein